jgi:predicted DNA-binding antitoxin AbrB/MazE fold protein
MALHIPMRYENGHFTPLESLPPLAEGAVVMLTLQEAEEETGDAIDRLLASAEGMPKDLTNPNNTAETSRHILETEYVDYLLERQKRDGL